MELIKTWSGTENTFKMTWIWRQNTHMDIHVYTCVDYDVTTGLASLTDVGTDVQYVKCSVC